MSFAEEDEVVASRIMDVLQDFVSQYVVYRFEPDSIQMIMRRLQEFEFGMSSLETFPIRILKMLAPGWLIGEIVDFTLFENRVRNLVRKWHVEKTAKLASQTTDGPVHFSDDLH